MSQATITPQHPAVVLRSRYALVRSMLAIAMIAVVCLAAAVVVLAVDGDDATPTAVSAPALSQPAPNGTTRFDGGPEEGTRGAVVAPALADDATRFDGGPEEGTRGAIVAPAITDDATRFDGGPEEGTRGAGH